MKKKTLILAGVLAAAAIAIVVANQRVQTATAADHLDGAIVQEPANVAGDITDLYAWMWDDGGTPAVALILNVNPIAMPNAAFPQTIHYAFNIDRGGMATQVICQFEADDNTAVRCWVGTDADNTIVTGDPTGNGIGNAGEIRVFAGLRDDPFFFNSAGFGSVRTYVNTNAGALPADNAFPGCFDLSGVPNPGNDVTILNAGLAIVDCLGNNCENIGNDDNTPAVDGFGTFNALSLVVSVPLTEINGTADNIAVYGSTHER